MPNPAEFDDYQDADDEQQVVEIINPENVPSSDLPLSDTQLDLVRQSGNPGQVKFPIVGIGGSAGSLEALEHFFHHLPLDTGMAFVVVTHQAASQAGQLTQLLQQFTRLPVQTAQDGMPVRPNHVYVNPPDQEISILHGTLLLFEPTQARSKRMPLDYFFQSLAKDARDRAICIILSGMGSDGVIGLKMVMENFGLVMVQSPDTAECSAMPRAAIATEFVDYVLPADQMPGRLLEIMARPPQSRRPRGGALSASEPAHALQKIFILIRERTGHDFSFYKRNTVFRRIERRMGSHQIKEFPLYVRYLQENPDEVDQLFRELLIGVTKFFRDQEAFELLKRCLLPLLRQKPVDSTIRVWAPGCSTGEEAYSLAILLLECLDAVEPGRYLKVQIFATDINPEGIEFARAGIYPENIVGDVSPERLKRFFTKVDSSYQIRKEVRDVVVFALHNLNKDAPFTKLDLLVCRNLLIYLSAELQKNLIPVFHYALNPSGILFLGPSENLTGFQDLFSPLDLKWKISRRLEGTSSLTRLANFPFSMSRHPAAPAPASSATILTPAARKDGPFASLVQRLLLRHFTPPAVVVNIRGEILFVNGRTGKYLEPAPGLGAMNLFEMAREELSYELSGAVHQASTTRQEVVADNVRVRTESGYQLLRLTVRYLQEPELLAGLLLVAFEDMPTSRKVRAGKAIAGSDLTRDAVVAALEKELQYTKHRLQTTIEEMESSLEELKSTNEELQSANEELQSTNEEAMTNKEEMQSLNEELMTLNMQYLSKTEELSQAANDMKNLLDATDIATIFLDNDMVIKRFTARVGRILPLLPSDVGRPISHFTSKLRHDTLVEDIQQVLDRLVAVDANIQTTSGEWYAMRILPYRTLDNYIGGAVITFTEITGLKQLEERLRASRSFAESIVETVQESLLILDHNLCVLAVSRHFGAAFHTNPDEVKGRPLAEFAGGAWDQPALRRELQRLLQGAELEFEDLALTVTLPDRAPQAVRIYGRHLRSDGQHTECVLLGIKEIS
ncbi:PAS domain-containing protein [Hymenobacter sp. BT175]|uniref:CheR family methyltransferase n=1 Tax=Hymenobacter translucens TaxID=2886507 RepID=UPI001D0E3FCF|nr:CheR family methyltransferase [Hymenobacter translucens]MCC2546483.1 PAS domain-containing protein [Hymenobacter translucens]